MITIIIKQTKPDSGRDNKVFRAYARTENCERRGKPLGASSSTTGNAVFGVMSCARKAFLKFNPGADPDELETRISLVAVRPGIYFAKLASKNG